MIKELNFSVPKDRYDKVYSKYQALDIFLSEMFNKRIDVTKISFKEYENNKLNTIDLIMEIECNN